MKRREKRTVKARSEEPIPALSAGLSHAMMAGVMLLATLPAFVTLPKMISVPREQARISPSSPAPGDAAPHDATVQVKDEWPQEDIARGKEQCMHVLASVAAEVEMLEPVRKGECGMPAPVLVKSIGSEPKVVFDPPVKVNCSMVSALAKWEKSTLQPSAHERFKSQVVRIVGASGYSCRNIYNLPNARLSQHALGNAIDIGGFGFGNGRTIVVLKGWGPTARDIKAKAEAEAKAKAKAKTKNTDAAKPSGQVTQASLTSMPSKLALRQSKAASGLVSAADAAEPAKPTNEALFLRSLHSGACREFGTVLGPEANDPHRNHFHLDLIPRRSRSYCE